MKTAYLSLRYTVPERRIAFIKGLKRLGYVVRETLALPEGPQDIMVTWNRIGMSNRVAKAFQQSGNAVIVTENAAWGNGLAGRKWYTLARDFHNTAGCFPVGGPERWDSLGVELAPFRNEGETVILPQRGIGSPPTTMPRGWPEKALAKYGGRIRKHPGKFECVPLEDDLAQCGRVVTWGSGAAVKALMMGIPVVSEMPNWIGEQDNTEAGRLSMFRSMSWGQWELNDIADGLAFEWLLS